MSKFIVIRKDLNIDPSVIESEGLTIGRDADLVLDDNPYLHRRLLEVLAHRDLVWLVNLGTRISVTVADDAAAAYSLGFTIDEKSGEADHRIRVRVGRPGLEVRHRESFRRTTLGERAEAALVAAATLDTTVNPLGLRLELGEPAPVEKRSKDFLVPILVSVLLTKFEGRLVIGLPVELVGAAIFGLASLTDWLDGYLARRRGQVTWVGQVLDPIADKLLISATLVSLVQLDLAPAWMVTVIIGREFAVTGLRSIAYARGLYR